MQSTRSKKLPRYASDEDAEKFVAESDLSEYDLSGFRRLSEVVEERRAGRPALGDKAKEHVSLRLDREVIAKFRATGKGWQGRINEVLRNSRPASSTAVYASRLAVTGAFTGKAAKPAAATAKKVVGRTATGEVVGKPAKATVAKKAAGAKAASTVTRPSAKRSKPASKKPA